MNDFEANEKSKGQVAARQSMKRLSGHVILGVGIATCLYVEPANAYVDPNLGGLLFQVFAPLLAVIIAFWGRVKLLCGLALDKLRNLFSRKP